MAWSQPSNNTGLCLYLQHSRKTTREYPQESYCNLWSLYAE